MPLADDELETEPLALVANIRLFSASGQLRPTKLLRAKQSASTSALVDQKSWSRMVERTFAIQALSSKPEVA